MNVAFLLSKADYSSERFINSNPYYQCCLSQLLLSMQNLFDAAGIDSKNMVLCRVRELINY